MSDAPSDVDEAARLARRLAALPEAAMRQTALREYLEATAPSAAIGPLDQIHRRGDHGGPPYDVALLALTALLNDDRLSYDLLSALYEAAKENGYDRLLDVFFSPTTPDLAGPATADRELTLGHRKTLARTGDRDALARLLRHPELEVVPHLLKNPRITERDVIALAAQRPTDPIVQRQLANAPRWIARYALKRTLVLNPHTPSDIALRLLPFLLRADLRLVQSMTTLPPALRESAERLLS